MATPYITPALLLSPPAGISWTIAPTLSAPTGQAQTAQLLDACWKATSQADTYCNQPLRAVLNTEQFQGPGMGRMSLDRVTGIAGLITRRSPVRSVAAVQVSPSAAFPPAWSLLAAGLARPRNPVITGALLPETGPGGGNAIDIAPGALFPSSFPAPGFAPGFMPSCNVRGGLLILASYVHGWPHCSLTAAAAQGATSVTVDDVTGWPGATGFVLDAAATEQATATAAAATTPVVLQGVGGLGQAGPGTVTLASPLANAHAAGTVVTALPYTVLNACVLLATVQALEVIEAVAVQSLTGTLPGGSGGLAYEAELALDPFRRIM